MNLIKSDGEKKIIEPSGTIARVGSERRFKGRIKGIDFYTSNFGEVKDLPDREPGVFYIVSRMVAEAVPDREDLVAPSELIRDDEGNIIGADGLDVVNQ